MWYCLQRRIFDAVLKAWQDGKWRVSKGREFHRLGAQHLWSPVTNEGYIRAKYNSLKTQLQVWFTFHHISLCVGRGFFFKWSWTNWEGQRLQSLNLWQQTKLEWWINGNLCAAHKNFHTKPCVFTAPACKRTQHVNGNSNLPPGPRSENFHRFGFSAEGAEIFAAGVHHRNMMEFSSVAIRLRDQHTCVPWAVSTETWKNVKWTFLTELNLMIIFGCSPESVGINGRKWYPGSATLS